MASLGFNQTQKMSQGLVLAPQMRQSLRILQAPSLELRDIITEELQSNPVLEEVAVDSGPRVDIEHGGEASTDTSDETPSDLRLGDGGASLTRLDADSRERWDGLDSGTGSASTWSSDDEERRQHFFDSLTSETSLQEHLVSQARLGGLDEKYLPAFEYLVGSLDDRGYLNASLEELTRLSLIPYEELNAAHEVLITLEPAGLGARDLRECLLRQLEAADQGDTLAAEIVRDHIDLLLRRRLPDLVRKTGAEMEEIREAIDEITALDPAPGRRFAADTNTSVEPDLRVEKNEAGEWSAVLLDERLPRLRLNPAYKDLLASAKLGSKDREYLSSRLRDGKFIIGAVEQRQQTILSITQRLLVHQLGFFEHGVSKLHPLVMGVLAEELGVHETTISRAVAGKYVATPHGVFELRWFFTSGYQTESGESVANTSVKDTIAKIVSHENPAKPYSDEKITQLLAEQNLKIARRTVAKYREELGILPTHLRKRV